MKNEGKLQNTFFYCIPRFLYATFLQNCLNLRKYLVVSFNHTTEHKSIRYVIVNAIHKNIKSIINKAENNIYALNLQINNKMF